MQYSAFAKHGAMVGEIAHAAGGWERQRRRLRVSRRLLDVVVPVKLLGNADIPVLVHCLCSNHRQWPLRNGHAHAVVRLQCQRVAAVERDPAKGKHTLSFGCSALERVAAVERNPAMVMRTLSLGCSGSVLRPSNETLQWASARCRWVAVVACCGRRTRPCKGAFLGGHGQQPQCDCHARESQNKRSSPVQNHPTRKRHHWPVGQLVNRSVRGAVEKAQLVNRSVRGTVEKAPLVSARAPMRTGHRCDPLTTKGLIRNKHV